MNSDNNKEYNNENYEVNGYDGGFHILIYRRINSTRFYA